MRKSLEKKKVDHVSFPRLPHLGSPVAKLAGFECASNLIRGVFGFYDPVVIFPSFSHWKVAVGAE